MMQRQPYFMCNELSYSVHYGLYFRNRFTGTQRFWWVCFMLTESMRKNKFLH